MTKINAAEILAGRYPRVFGKKDPMGRAVAVLDYHYIGAGGETITKFDLAKGIKLSGEKVLEQLNGILESYEFQDLAILLVIAEEAGVNDLSQVVGFMKKLNFSLDELKKPNVAKILKNDLQEVGPRRLRKREPFSSIGNFDPELDMPPTIEEARYRSSNWQSPW